MTQVPGLVVWAILAYNNFATAYEISYMDCKKPLRIHSYNVAKLCAFEDNKTIPNIPWPHLAQHYISLKVEM